MDMLALFDPTLEKIGLIRKYTQENPKAFLDDAIKQVSLQEEFVESNKELLDDVKKNEYSMPESPSVNLQDLDEITKIALDDYHESVNPQLTGDLEYDNTIRVKADGFFKSRCKNYAEEIESIIDNMIIIEEYDASLFRNYKELTKLVLNTEKKESAIYLRKLISVARFLIPAMSRYIETSIVEGGITSKSNIPDA